MNRKYLTTILTAAALGLSTGCASSGAGSMWASVPNPFRRTPVAETEAETQPEKFPLASLAKPFGGNKNSEELSPEFRAAQKTFKKHPEKTLLTWARYQEDIGEYAEARKMYRELQIAYPKNMEAQLGMARIELLTGRSNQAEEILAKLKKTYPRNTEVRLAFGRMYSQQEKWDQAILAYEEACEIAPESQESRYELGVAFARSGDFDHALSHLAFSVGEPAAHYNIGYILHEQGKDADAVEWFRNALELHPDQQTADKSKAMLAKLSPQSDSNDASRESIAVRASSSRNSVSGTARIIPGGVAAMQPAGHSAAAVRSELPVVSSGRQHAGSSQSQPMSQSSMNVDAEVRGEVQPADPSLFRTVSYGNQSSVTPEQPATREPPQWKGPSRPNAPPVVPDAVATKDPVNWHARRAN